jgi:hypothetical protein
LPRPVLPELRRDSADVEILAGLDLLAEVLRERLVKRPASELVFGSGGRSP